MHGFLLLAAVAAACLFATTEAAIITTEHATKTILNTAAATTIDGRIVGGWETSINYFPHQVSLQKDLRHVCGAAIISASTVITAAHCVSEYAHAALYAIRAGSTDCTAGGVYIRVRRIVPHENFNIPTPLNNDIALIALAEHLIFNRNIQPIALSTSKDAAITQKTPLYVSGWGAISTYAQHTELRLRYTTIVQRDQNYCVRAYAHAGTVTSTMLCAGSEFGGRDSCQGDSGGPLVTLLNGRMSLYGIVSWGLSCANVQYPGIYTKVSAYNDWIAQTMVRL